MEFLGEMNIYRESELSGDFEGEIRERRNQQEKNQASFGGSETNPPCKQLYLLSQNRCFTHLMLYGLRVAGAGAFLGILGLEALGLVLGFLGILGLEGEKAFFDAPAPSVRGS
ncbi:hypothetical protein CK203_041863 [Vitis vinifera]|uniref:Uncharacterized protein n=1 Tax=Vitis vinifera TaxID=29760 RepID=A0A438FY66_VITVI|nr:hypothetical protein CK203_041863 [Vitis vinifera]